MDTIRLYLRSNSFQNSRIKIDSNNKNLLMQQNINEKHNNNNNLLINNVNNDILIRRCSSNEKLFHENLKSLLSLKSSSSSLFSKLKNISSQIETYSGLSNSTKNPIKNSNIVANASSSISNAHSLTYENNLKEIQTKRQRQYSSNNERYLKRRSSLINSKKRTQLYRYSNHRRKNLLKKNYSTEKIKNRIIKVNRLPKTVSFIYSTNINKQKYFIISTQSHSVKSTAANAFLTAALIFKYWVEFLLLNSI